jgi:hypothetical protein
MCLPNMTNLSPQNSLPTNTEIEMTVCISVHPREERKQQLINRSTTAL